MKTLYKVDKKTLEVEKIEYMRGFEHHFMVSYNPRRSLYRNTLKYACFELFVDARKFIVDELDGMIEEESRKLQEITNRIQWYKRANFTDLQK